MKDQIQFETNGLTVLAVKVHSQSYGFKMVISDIFSYRLSDKDNRCQTLGPGNWKLHAVTDSMTEEQAKALVKCDMNWDFKFGYQNYEATKDHVYKFPFDTATAAIPGLLRSHGIDPDEKWVLLVCE